MSAWLGRAAIILTAAVMLGSCNDEETVGPEDFEVAEARLFDAMNRNNFAEAGQIVATMYELRDKSPLTYRNTFLLGATALWWLAESSSHPEENGLMITRQAIPLILEAFPDVIINDEGNRAGAMALLGAFLSDLGLDRVQGNILIEQAVGLRPEVGLFQRMHIRRFGFADDSVTNNSIEAGYKFWEFCTGSPVSRTNPDFTGRVGAPTSDEHKRFCWGSDRVPHGYEGAMMIFGDLLVKRGDFVAARRAYENARLGPNYSRWKHRGENEARLNSNLNARHATYANRESTAWAPIGVPAFSCTQCHESVH
jgi:hypothetical protein